MVSTGIVEMVKVAPSLLEAERAINKVLHSITPRINNTVKEELLSKPRYKLFYKNDREEHIGVLMCNINKERRALTHPIQFYIAIKKVYRDCGLELHLKRYFTKKLDESECYGQRDSNVVRSKLIGLFFNEEPDECLRETYPATIGEIEFNVIYID